MKQDTKDNLTAGVMVTAILMVAAFSPPANVRFTLGFAAVVATLLFAVTYVIARQLKAQNDRLQAERSRGAVPDAVDPWAMQAELMKISDQDRPAVPVLSKNSVMYSALLMEELSETLRLGMVPALDRLIAACAGRDRDEQTSLRVIRGKVQESGHTLDVHSKIVRQHLRALNDFRMTLSRAEAVPLFDGTTDVAVVNCGFALASGLDGAAGYFEVARSNLSKRNPDTGVIDKTPDGKWIKGRDYFEPDLAAVLDASFDRDFA